MSMLRSVVLGCGSYLPSRVVTNHELAKAVETSDEWIVQRTGIIGWNLQQSWFQRRAGLVTLVATTAAGSQAYAAIDVPEGTAIALADRTMVAKLWPSSDCIAFSALRSA